MWCHLHFSQGAPTCCTAQSLSNMEWTRCNQQQKESHIYSYEATEPIIWNHKKRKYLKDSISRTGLATGISIKRELVKNCSRLLASRFLGIFAAESLMVSREYNLLTCAFYRLLSKQSHTTAFNLIRKTRDRRYRPKAYQLSFFRPLQFLKQTTFSPSSWQHVPCLIIISTV